MICTKCKQYFKEGMLQCPVCWARKSHEIYVEFQKQFLPPILAGKAKITRVRTLGNQWHIALIGDRNHGWCGIEFKPRLGEASFDPERLDVVCPDCRKTFEDLVQEAEGAA